ncbi:myb-related protein [Corchorus capsularis]|uniref:Myb-related protein n=1 Tax=Corchorus capsularis TaxID=210143 RepID=A0A1R3I9P3_COCAP|nr:myb-related protein [Corchorus capsularis]
MAKQALSDALAPVKSSDELTEQKPSINGYISYAKPGGYASSTENIAKLLKGWMRNPSKLAPANSGATQQSFDNMGGTDSASSEGNDQSKEDKSSIEMPEAFEDSMFVFQSNFDSSNSDFSQSMSPEASLNNFQDESKPEDPTAVPQGQLSLLEKWLFDDGGANQGKDYLSDITLDENANFF